MADAERIDQPMERDRPLGIDRIEERIDVAELPLLLAECLLPLLAGLLLALPRLRFAHFEDCPLQRVLAIAKSEYVARRLDETRVEKRHNLLLAEAFDIEGKA